MTATEITRRMREWREGPGAADAEARLRAAFWDAVVQRQVERELAVLRAVGLIP